MRILHEMDNGAYVLEVIPKRLYAKIEKYTDIPTYAGTVSPLLIQGHFHEWRESDPKFEKAMFQLVKTDLKEVVGNVKVKETNEESI